MLKNTEYYIESAVNSIGQVITYKFTSDNNKVGISKLLPNMNGKIVNSIGQVLYQERK